MFYTNNKCQVFLVLLMMLMMITMMTMLSLPMCDSQGGKKPLRRAPPYPPTSSQKMLEGVEDKAMKMFDRDFRTKIGQRSPEDLDVLITVSRFAVIHIHD